MSWAKTPPCSVPGLLVASAQGAGGPKLSHKEWVPCWQDPLALRPCLSSCHHPPSTTLATAHSWAAICDWLWSPALGPSSSPLSSPPQPSEFPPHPPYSSTRLSTGKQLQCLFHIGKTGFHSRQRSLLCGVNEGGG